MLQQSVTSVCALHASKQSSSSFSGENLYALLQRLTLLRSLKGLPPPRFCGCQSPPTSSSKVSRQGSSFPSLLTAVAIPGAALRTPTMASPLDCRTAKSTASLLTGLRCTPKPVYRCSTASTLRSVNAYLQVGNCQPLLFKLSGCSTRQQGASSYAQVGRSEPAHSIAWHLLLPQLQYVVSPTACVWYAVQAVANTHSGHAV